MDPQPTALWRGALLALVLVASACEPAPGEEGGSACGPTGGVVERVVDGDTVDLSDGTRLRLLLVDTPETTGGKNECYGAEATAFLKQQVLGQNVSVSYDTECTDKYDRLLAYISVEGREINKIMVERGFAKVLFIPPNGESRESEYKTAEAVAKANCKGLWGVCEGRTCN